MTTPSSVTKDNSSIVEDSGINASDGATALRDEAFIGNRDNLFGGDFGIGDGNEIGNFVIENLGDEVAREAFGFGTNALAFGEEAIRLSNDLALAGLTEALDIAGSAQTQLAQTNQNALEAVRRDASEQREADKEDSRALIEKIIIFGTAAIIGVAYLNRRKS